MLSPERVTTTAQPTTRRWLGVVMLLGRVAHAAAQSPPEPVRVHVSVEADPQCATPATIAAQVRKRSQRIELVGDTSDVPHLRVAIGAGEGRDRVAELVLSWPDGRRAERRLSAASCAAAVDALALVVAMTLDPAAFRQEEARAETGATPGGTGSGAETETAAGSETASEWGSEPDTGSGAGSSTATAAASDTDTPSPLSFAHFALGANAHLLSSPSPHAMPGAGLYARLIFTGSGLWSPALGLQLVHAWADGLAEPGGNADFALDLAELDVCPLGAQVAAFTAHACLASAIGRLSASGSKSYASQGHDELWASLGGALLASVRLASWLELQAGFGLAAPVRRYGFAFEPDVFYRVPKLGLEGHLGAGVRFP